MFNDTVKRFVGNYHYQNREFRSFLNNVYVEQHGDKVEVHISNRKVDELTAEEFRDIVKPLTDCIGSSSRHRHFALYQYLKINQVSLSA